MAGNGKIARLPREIREELNRRMENGEQGGSLLCWLNSLPAMQSVLARDFNGKPVSKQNLCEWRAGGFVEWRARQEMLAQTRELAADAKELTEAAEGKLTDHLATVLAARYAAALADWNGDLDELFRRKLRVLHGLCLDIVELRRGDHSGARIKMEHTRLERERVKSEEEVLAQFQKWAGNKAVRDSICQNCLSPAERQRRIQEIFGMPIEPPRQSPAGSPESNQVKAGQTILSSNE